MAIDLPPVTPPQVISATIAQQRNQAATGKTIKLQIGDRTLLIDGNNYLSEEKIRKAAALVKSPAKFILLLNLLYAAKGYPYVNVVYAFDRATHIIYVNVNEGYLDKVIGPPILKSFFEGYEGKRNLKISELEGASALAGIKAKRAGYNVTAQNSTANKLYPDKFTLTLKAKPDPDHHALHVSTVFGNPGNRFLGRYFGFASAQYYTPTGDILGLNYGRAFTSLGNSRGGDAYNNYGLSYSNVNPYGLYNLSASYTDYKISNRFGFGESEDAQITRGGIEGSQFLYASDKTRWLLSERVEYNDSVIKISNAPRAPITLGDGTVFPVKGQRTQDEHYAAARLGTSISRAWRLFGQEGSISLGGNYKRGFAGDVDNLVSTNRDADFNVFTGEATLTYIPFFGIVTSLKVEGQQSLKHELPQQEQWVLGGPGRLSAFLPGVLVGDNGSYARFQIQLPKWDLPAATLLRLSGFIEGGTAEFEDRRGSTAPVRAASDAGVKIELAVSRWLMINAYVAESLGEKNLEIFPGPEVVRDSRANFFFTVTANY